MFEQDQLAPATSSPARIQAAVTAARAVAGSDPDDLFPCPCNCGCTTDTSPGGVTAITNKVAGRSSAVRDTVRCAWCVDHGHFGAVSPLSGDLRTSAAIEVIYPVVNPANVELNRLARIESDEMQFEESYERWRAEIPDRYRGAWTESVEVLAALARLERGVSAGSGLFLAGPFGSGKTWRAHAYARQVVEKRIFKPQQVRIGTEAEMLSDIDTAPLWGDNSSTVRLRRLLDPGVRMYVIDDVGNQTKYVNEDRRHDLWARFIDRVYGSDDGTTHSKKATTLVLTTNLDASKELVDAQGNPVLGPNGLVSPGELREWVGDVAYDKIAALMGTPTNLVNEVNASTPRGSHRKQVEYERNQQYLAGISTPVTPGTAGVAGTPGPKPVMPSTAPTVPPGAPGR